MTGQVWIAYRSTQKPWRYEFAPSRERVVAGEAVPILLTTDVAAALDRYRALGFTATATASRRTSTASWNSVLPTST